MPNRYTVPTNQFILSLEYRELLDLVRAKQSLPWLEDSIKSSKSIIDMIERSRR